MCWIIPDKLVILKQQYDIISGHVHGCAYLLEYQNYKSSVLIMDIKS